MVLGILTFVCLGPLAGIAAVICGHLALSAIKKSGGTLGGNGMAIAGLAMGYVGTVLSIIVVLPALLLPALSAARDQARKAEARTTVMAITAAVKQYYVEYGKYPTGAATGEDVTFSTDNNRVFDILRAVPGTEAENPRRIVFLEAKTSQSTPPKNGFGSDGVLYDPWGKPYFIRIDTNNDGQVANPYRKNGGPDLVRAGVIVWSLGPDGELGTKGNGDGAADILSWEPIGGHAD